MGDTDAGETTETKQTLKGKKGTRASIAIEGEAPPGLMDRVLDGNGKAGRGTAPDSKLFARAIRSLDCTIECKRQSPSTTADGTPLSDTFSDIDPTDDLTEREIVGILSEARGGDWWTVKVLDQNNGIVASKRLKVPGEPKLDPIYSQQTYDPTDGQPQEDPPDAEQLIQDEIEKDPEIIERKKRLRMQELAAQEKRAQTEQLKLDAEFEEAKQSLQLAKRGGFESATGNGSGNGHGNGKSDEIQRMIEAATAPLKAEREADRKALEFERKKNDERDGRQETQRMIDSANAPLKALLDGIDKRLSVPPPQGPSTNDILQQIKDLRAEMKGEIGTAIVGALKDVRNEFDKNITRLESKLDAAPKGDSLATTAVNALTKIATTPQVAAAAAAPPMTIKDLTGAMSDLANVKNLMSGEGGSTPPDTASFIVDRLVGVIPELIPIIESKLKIGEIPTREEIEQNMSKAAFRVHAELEKTMKNEVRAGFDRLQQRRPAGQQQPPAHSALPAPVGQQQGPPPPGFVGAQVMQAPHAQPQAPIAYPSGAQTLPAQQTTTAALASAEDPEVIVACKHRVGAVLTILLKEIKIGAEEMQWPVGALRHLPRKIINQIVAADAAEQVADAVRPYADAKVLDEIWTFVVPSNPEHEWNREWITNGINWIKKAIAGKLEDGETDGGPVEEGPPVTQDS